MNVNDVLSDAFERLPELVRSAVDGLTPEQLRWSPAPAANPVGWLVWHLTRVQDHQIAHLLDREQMWASGDWAGRFGLPPDPANTGYRHTSAQVATVRPDSAQVLVDYYDAVAARTRALVRDVTPEDLDRIVDQRWDPPVTLGVRLVSVLSDDLQHVGQAAYVRGLVQSG